MQPPTPATTGEIVHRLPGRLRVRIPQLRYDSTEPTKLKQSLSALTGVTEVRVNSAASSIVITYQVDRLTEPALLTHLGLTTPPDVPSRFDATQSNQTTRSDSKQEHKEHLKEEIGEVIGADFGEAVGEVVGEGIGALLGVSGAWVGGGIGGAIGEAVGEKVLRPLRTLRWLLQKQKNLFVIWSLMPRLSLLPKGIPRSLSHPTMSRLSLSNQII